MSGVEIAVAVISITAGIGTCIRLTNALVKKYKGKRKAKADEAERLNNLLQEEEEQVKREFDRVAALRGKDLVVKNDQIQSAISKSEEMLGMLKEQLQELNDASEADKSVDFEKLISMATQSQQLALDALRQLNAASATNASLLSGVTLNENDDTITLVGDDERRDALPRPRDSLCQAALMYRNNAATFEQLTTRETRYAAVSWRCAVCTTYLDEAKLNLTDKPKEGFLYLTPAGMMKSHCRSTSGFVSWTCIWAHRVADCEVPFAKLKDLLKHFRDCHTGTLKGQFGTFVDLPSETDRRASSRNAESCGYGLRLHDEKMRNGREGFIVHASLNRTRSHRS